MKKCLLLILLLTLSVAACKHGPVGVKGSGNREVQKREVATFTSIETEGALNIEVICQKDVSLEIEGDDNILPLISTEVSGGVLELKSTKGYSTSQPILVRITVPTLEGLSVSGAGKFNITGLKTQKFQIEANGAPEIKASGSAESVSIDTSGAGSIDLHSLEAAKAVVESKGVAKVVLDVRDHLDVTISGPSTVTYQGNPTINKTIHGPGKLEKRGGQGA